MPLFGGDIATSKSCFKTHLFTPSPQILLHNNILFGNDKRWFFYGWNLFQIPKKKYSFQVFPIMSVSTIEQKYSIRINGGGKVEQQNHSPNFEYVTTSKKEVQYSGDESEEVDEKEKLRRKRISKANSGKTPWNKGKKHSEETKRRIKERTSIAMQNPKIKMKLANMGHTQSDETRVKIGVSVRTMWEKRREKLTLQEMCHFEWQNLIAEAFRKGFNKEEELQWDSYEKLDEELEQEWLESIEERKQMPRPKGHKRAPKSLEQRKKIAAAIAAKWADPTYRNRVQSALSKYHKSPARAERQPRRKPSDETQRQPRPPKPKMKKIKDIHAKHVKTVIGAERQRNRLRRRNVPIYKDPLAGSKLEMIKNIKAQRAAAGNEKFQAIEQAKILIAEAEKAAKALEAAALTSPLAQASLFETRNLIAEAIQSLQSMDIPEADSSANGQVKTYNGSPNGTLSLNSSDSNINDFGFGEYNFKELVTVHNKDPSTRSSFNGIQNNSEAFNIPGLNGHALSCLEMNGKIKHDKTVMPNGECFKFGIEEMKTKSKISPKKWICGRLVEVVEGDEVRVQ